MKKVKIITGGIFILFFMCLFLSIKPVKATIICGVGQVDCGSVCCNTNTDCCTNTGCQSISSDACSGGKIINPVAGNLNTQNGVSLIQTLITDAITIAFVLGAVIFFFMLVFGGIQWIGSGGDKQAIEGAKAKITNALIGLVILFSVFAVVGLIGKLFNINLLHPVLPSLSTTNTTQTTNTTYTCQGSCVGVPPNGSCLSVGRTPASGTCATGLNCCQ